MGSALVLGLHLRSSKSFEWLLSGSTEFFVYGSHNRNGLSGMDVH